MFFFPFLMWWNWNIAAGHGGAEHARCSGILVVVFPNSKSEPKGLSTNELLNTLRLVSSLRCEISFCGFVFHLL